jgi:hypothetical protein
MLRPAQRRVLVALCRPLVQRAALGRRALERRAVTED